MSSTSSNERTKAAALRFLRAASLAVGAVLGLTWASDHAEAGVIFSVEAGMQSAAQAKSLADSPAKAPLDEGQVPGRSLAHRLAPGSGAGNTGASGGGSVSSSTSTSALSWAACELPPPELVSALQGEGPLFFQPPPVFELLDPPRG